MDEGEELDLNEDSSDLGLALDVTEENVTVYHPLWALTKLVRRFRVPKRSK